MKYLYNVTNAGGVKLNQVLQCLFQKNMYPALHLRPSGARDFGRHRVRGVAEEIQEFCCYREELVVARGVMPDPGDVLSRVAGRKSCHTGVHR